MSSCKNAPVADGWQGVFAGAVGLWLALALIKFGNPVILDQQVKAPVSGEELLVSPWPVAWGYALLAVVIFAGARGWRWNSPIPRWFLAAPLVWLCWQLVSATQTVDRALTMATLPHFVSCVAAFYVGLFALSQVSRLKPFWIGLVGGFMVVLAIGWRQHFGGLEETRRFFYSLPDWQSYPPEFLKKVSSNRIYSTLVYPNALAGVVLLLLPVTIATLLHGAGSRVSYARLAAAGASAILAAGCLYWSGSKAGWLIALAQGMAALLWLPLRKTTKVMVLILALCGGLGAFWLKYHGYFGRGATSVAARADYWRAAWQTLVNKPMLGSGPGTFGVRYRAIKAPEAEMTRLVHNDFLQQGSDSGWMGLMAYAAWVLGGVLFISRKSISHRLFFGVWLGLAGIVAQSIVEFGLFIPALAWPFFLLFGWLAGVENPANQIDSKATPA
jgi:hypothetical protein